MYSINISEHSIITDNDFKLSSEGFFRVKFIKALTICYKNNITLNITYDKNIYTTVLLNNKNKIMQFKYGFSDKAKKFNSIELLNEEINRLKKIIR
jgi:hypothetical protein